MHQRRGFTLIELLVVIAIIGVLSAIVLVSLGSTRLKGVDTAAKNDFNGMRAQAELFYYANGNSYATVCTSAGVGGVKSISAQFVAAAGVEGALINTTLATAGTSATTATCHDQASPAGWAAEVPLKTGGMYCVDSTGLATTTPLTSLGSSDIACG